MIAVLIFGAINAASIARLELGRRAPFAHLANALVQVVGLPLALGVSRPLGSRISIVGFLCGLLYFIVQDKLPTPDSEVYFGVQQVSLWLTLTFWMLVREATRVLDGGWQGMDYAIGGSLRLLFIGTLAAVPATMIAGTTGWKRYPSLAAATCPGQIGIGLLDLGRHSPWPVLSVVGLGFTLYFVVLAGIALMPRQSSVSTS